MGLTKIARHVKGCHGSQGTRVQNGGQRSTDQTNLFGNGSTFIVTRMPPLPPAAAAAAAAGGGGGGGGDQAAAGAMARAVRAAVMEWRTTEKLEEYRG